MANHTTDARGSASLHRDAELRALVMGELIEQLVQRGHDNEGTEAVHSLALAYLLDAMLTVLGDLDRLHSMEEQLRPFLDKLRDGGGGLLGAFLRK